MSDVYILSGMTTPCARCCCRRSSCHSSNLLRAITSITPLTPTLGHNTLMRFMFKHRHNRRPLSVPPFSLSLAHSPPDSFNYYRCILICDNGGGVVAVSGMPMLSATRPSAPYAGVFFFTRSQITSNQWKGGGSEKSAHNGIAVCV